MGVEAVSEQPEEESREGGAVEAPGRKLFRKKEMVTQIKWR